MHENHTKNVLFCRDHRLIGLVKLVFWIGWAVMAAFCVLAIMPFVIGRRFRRVRPVIRWILEVAASLVVFGAWYYALVPNTIPPNGGLCFTGPIFGLTNYGYDDSPLCVQVNQAATAAALAAAIAANVLAMLVLATVNRRHRNQA